MSKTAPVPGVLEKFFTENEWCQGACARTKAGNECGTVHPKAHSFCLIGSACVLHIDSQHLDRLFDAAKEEGFTSVSRFNDQPGMTREKIIDFCKRHHL